MTPDHVDTLLAILASAGVVGRLEETAPDVWEDALADIDGHEAIQAARQLIRTHRWVKIADVIEAVEKTRGDRARDFQGPGLSAEVPDADPDDVPAYLAAIRAQRTRAALGQTLQVRPALEAAIKSVGWEVPDHDEPGIRRPGPLGQHCPSCSAPVGRPCRLPSGRERSPHRARSAAAGVPGVDAPLPPEQAAVEEQRRRQAARIHLAAMSGDQ